MDHDLLELFPVDFDVFRVDLAVLVLVHRVDDTDTDLLPINLKAHDGTLPNRVRQSSCAENLTTRFIYCSASSELDGRYTR